ncbi:MAG: DNA-protecting protein DprA, partial [Gammaproteobacteria bacterium]|nr:DNA-protecting protein DprA [Gammaproteobacteria bacterium]
MAKNNDVRAFWLALNRIKGLGPVGQRKLLDAFPSIKEIFSADAHALREFGFKEKTINAICQPDWDSVEADLLWLDNPGHHLVTIDSDEYP